MLTGCLPLGRFDPPSHRAAVDPRLDGIILRALEREPDRRYRQAGEMKSAIEALHSGAAPRAENAGGGDTTLLAAPPVAAETPGRGGVRGFLLDSTNWAILCCFAILLAGLPVLLERQYPGMPPWIAVPLVCVFIVLLLLLLATSFIEPIPLWRALLLIAAGGDIILLTWVYQEEWVRKLPRSDLMEFVYTALVLGIVLTLLGTYQVRQVLMRRYHPSRRDTGGADTPPTVPPAGNSRT